MAQVPCSKAMAFLPTLTELAGGTSSAANFRDCAEGPLQDDPTKKITHCQKPVTVLTSADARIQRGNAKKPSTGGQCPAFSVGKC